MTIPEHHMHSIRDITMTDEERRSLRQRLNAYAITHPAPHSLPGRVWGWSLRHGVLALGLVLALIAGGTGVSAELARPGDTLYGFRLAVNDRVETALAFSDDAQVDVEMQQLQRMIDDEDAVRDDELSPLTFGYGESENGNDDIDEELRALERELNQEELLDFGEGDDSGEPSSTPEPLDDGSFKHELRSIEQELQAEERARLELE